MASLEGVGGGQVHQTEQTADVESGSTGCASNTEAPVELQQTANPEAAAEAWAAHSCNTGAQSIEDGLVAGDVNYKPDINTMEEFYETAEPFFRRLDGEGDGWHDVGVQVFDPDEVYGK